MDSNISLAPIVLFVYNRPWHTEQTLNALMQNDLADYSVLYVFADGAKPNATDEDLEKITAVRQLVKSRQWCKEVIVKESEKNKGLADSIIEGVTKVVNQYGKIIVLEDDVITSPGFLKYMNDALNFYAGEEKVYHISGYMFPVTQNLPETFFYNTSTCWGWGTWDRAWTVFNNDATFLLAAIDKDDRKHQFNINGSYDFYGQLEANKTGQLKTWAVKWYASFFLHNGFSLHPYPSLVNNIGHDGFGENCIYSNIFYWNKLAKAIMINKIEIEKSELALEAMINYNNSMHVQPGEKHFIKAKRILEFRLRKIGSRIKKKIDKMLFKKIFNKFSEFTMIPKDEYLRNLAIAERTINTPGAIVECGVWRGGMIAGIASILGKDREYYLFDSFEGLPQVKDIDGKDAANWQKNTTGVDYFDNCKAEAEYANKAMKIANVDDDAVHIVKGWFNETLPLGNYEFPISLLRLDGDWYESTMTCLQYLFPNVVSGGIIIIDDYHTWEGCAKAIHDYLSRNGRPERICQYNNKTAYLVKSSS